MTYFVEAIKLPFSDWKKLSIGALLYLLPIVSIITGIFAYGYALRAAKLSAQRKFVLPEWNNWGDLFVKGILAFVIALVYALPAIVLFVIALWSFFVALVAALAGGEILTMDPDTFSTVIVSAAGILLLAVILYLVACYVMPMALMHYVNKGRFGAAFEFRSVFREAFTAKYLGGLVVAFLYAVAVAIIGTVLSAVLQITIVLPYVVSAFMSIIMSLTLMSIYGQLYAETSTGAQASAAPRAAAKRKKR